MDVIDVDIRSFSYKGEDFAALKNVRFSVERGELVVLTGNSGCGKTTLLRAMNGLIPDQYEGELDGRIELLVGMYMRQESYSYTIISSLDNRTHAEVSPGYAHG